MPRLRLPPAGFLSRLQLLSHDYFPLSRAHSLILTPVIYSQIVQYVQYCVWEREREREVGMTWAPDCTRLRVRFRLAAIYSHSLLHRTSCQKSAFSRVSRFSANIFANNTVSKRCLKIQADHNSRNQFSPEMCSQKIPWCSSFHQNPSQRGESATKTVAHLQIRVFQRQAFEQLQLNSHK